MVSSLKLPDNTFEAIKGMPIIIGIIIALIWSKWLFLYTPFHFVKLKMKTHPTNLDIDS